MKIKTIISIGILIAFILGGCVTVQIRPALSTLIATERISKKNYELGQRLTVYVGQPIVKVKDYTVLRFKANHMRASDDFVLSSGFHLSKGYKNTDYVVLGETMIGTQKYTVLRLPGEFGTLGAYGALINTDGSVAKMLSGDLIIGDKDVASPADLKFRGSKEEERIDLNVGYLNYELIYGGTDGESMSITYREYTSKDFARPAFYQNLVYQADKAQIRFKYTVLKIHELTNEKIVFTVVSDGLPK